MLPSEKITEQRYQRYQPINSVAAVVSQSNSNSSSNGNSTINRKMSGDSSTSTPSTTSGGITCNSYRRKSALNYHHQQQYMKSNNGSSLVCGGTNTNTNTSSTHTGSGNDHYASAAGGRYSPHPNDLYFHHSSKLALHPVSEDSLSCCLPPPSPAPHNDRFCSSTNPTNSSTIGSNESSDCFISVHHHHHQQQQHQHQHHPQQQSLSTSTSASSLSTNSGCGPQHQHHHHHPNKYNLSTSTITPNRPLSPSTNRFRTSDRFREKHSLTPSNGGIDSHVQTTHHTPVHASSLSNDTYSYLNASMAHTPVKRYIPTPPPAHDIYTPKNVATPPDPSSSHHLCTLPYRLRVKCCDQRMIPSSTASTQSVEPHILSVADYYTTTPRTRPSITDNLNQKRHLSIPNSTAQSPNHILQSEQQIQNLKCLGSPTPAASPSNILTGHSSSSSCNRQNTSLTSNRLDYIGHAPSIEYINVNTNGNNVAHHAGTGVMSPILMKSNGGVELPMSYGQNTESNSSNNAGAGASTCLHCNTTRRTTGVHQTTQTTGPISPIPIQPPLQTGVGVTNYCIQDQMKSSSSSPITPATSETPLSPMPAAAAFEGQQMNFQHVKTSVQVPDEMQQKSKDNSINNVCQQPISHHAQAQAAAAVTNQQQQQQASSNTVSQQQQQQRFITTTRKKRLSQYLRREIARFFGVEINHEAEDEILWLARQRRLALRRFGSLKNEREFQLSTMINDGKENHCLDQHNSHYAHHHTHAPSERPDILPAQDTAASGSISAVVRSDRRTFDLNFDFQPGDLVERKASVASMISSGLSYIISTLGGGKSPRSPPRQWSRSFAPLHVRRPHEHGNSNMNDDEDDFYGGFEALPEDEMFFDSPNAVDDASNNGGSNPQSSHSQAVNAQNNSKISGSDAQRQQMYIGGERAHGWRTTSVTASGNSVTNQDILNQAQMNQQQQQQSSPAAPNSLKSSGLRGMRISPHILDGVLENSRRPLVSERANQKLFTIADLDDRTDHRPFFTYWINTVQILVLFLSLICYGIGPIGLGVEQRTGQVLVTSLSLQTVQHSEQRNIWIGPRYFDLVHMGAKFATCMRRDVKIVDVMFKTRRQERETACCIRNDDSGCVQSSQADCSVRGLFPTKSISTWKKWSPGESGPGGRISGSVCGLDPKYCDAPASIAPYEWPDDITKWPICRKTNSFSQRFRFKDHTAEHMVCEVIGHPCCTGVFGECRITTREYCDFVNGYFHEEASLCSQVSCLSNVCGMFPFLSVEVPDQFYRLFTSLCMHAGILHLAITVAFQHVFLADLERMIGPIRVAIVYFCSGIAGNLTSAILVPYELEVGPLASLAGVLTSLIVLLVLSHWKHLRKPHIALLKLLFIGALLFALGTLPCQLNLVGLFAAMISSVFLTIALVPFVSISSYVRKSKINFIWSCVIFHFFFYSFVLVIFYVFPTELTNLNFGDVFSNTFNTNVGGINRNRVIGGDGGGGGSYTESRMGGQGGDVLSSTKNFERRDHSIMYYPESYIVNAAATLQIIDGKNEIKSRNRLHRRADINNRINKNFTNVRDILLYGNLRGRDYNNNNAAKTVFFQKEKKSIAHHSNNSSSSSSSNARPLKTAYNVTRLNSKFSDYSKLTDKQKNGMSSYSKVTASASSPTASAAGAAAAAGSHSLSDNQETSSNL